MPRGRKKRCPYGMLDATAAAMLARWPQLTRVKIATALGCSPKSLMNREKYPLLARMWDQIKAKRLDRHPDATFIDRRRNGKAMGNPDGEYGIDSDFDDDWD